MRVPQELGSLVEMGIIEEVVRPLMSGKEAQLYVVIAGGEQRVAKVYKDAAKRSFKQRADYTEGRKVRNSRDRRAMSKRSKHGRSQDEAGWRSAEVDVIYRLREAGVRVPAPYNFYDGVLVMEMVTGPDGYPAPRLGDLEFSPEQARAVYDQSIQEVVRMLCAGIVHGDLSDFNILMSADGPVIIDFPQAVDPASNSSARSLLIRDVDNLHRFLSRSLRHRAPPYAQEMWNLFERNELQPDTRLSGQFRDKRRKANTKQVLDLIGDAARDEERRRRGQDGQNQGRGRQGRRGSRGAQAQQVQVQVLVRSSDGRAKVVQRGSQPEDTGRPARGERDRGRGESARTEPGKGRRAKGRDNPRGASTERDPERGRKPEGRERKPEGRGRKPEGASARPGGQSARSGDDASRSGAGAKSGEAPAKKRRRRRRRSGSGGGGPGKPDATKAPEDRRR